MLLCASYIAGLALARHFPPPLSWTAGFAVLLSVLAVGAFIKQKKEVATVLLAAVFFTVGMLNLVLVGERINRPVATYLGREVNISGYIHSMEAVEGETGAFIFHVSEIAGEEDGHSPVNALVRVSVYRFPSGLKLSYGQRLSMQGMLLAPAGKRNPGGFDYASYLETAGVSALLSVNGAHVVELPGRGGSFLVHWGENLRGSIVDRLKQSLPPAEAGLAAGLLLGTRSYLEEETADAYSTLGIAHLLAVSGLHVGFVFAFALFLARRLRLSSGTGLLFTVVFILLYILLVGGRPSVWRAALMLGMAIVARQYGREADARQGLAAAALILLLVRPYWLFTISFQLSFAATLGILLLTPRLQPFFSRLPRGVSSLLAATLSAQLAVLPLQVIYFGLLPLLAVPVNLLCVPLVGLFMLLGLSGMIAGLIFAPLAAPFYTAALPVLYLLDRLPRLLASLPLTALQLQPPPAVWLIYAGVLLMFVLCVRLRPTRVSLLAVLLLFNMACWGSLATARGPGKLEVTFIDVGQGLSVFIRTAEGKTVLVDAGGSRGGSFDPGERVVLPFLLQRQVKKLDLLMLTHPHEDHYGGMSAVVNRLPVGRFVSSGEREDSPSFTGLLASLKEHSIPLVDLSAGDRIILDSVTSISILSPPQIKLAGTIDDVNNNSLVMLLEYGSFSLLVTGDAEREALELLVAANVLPAVTVLQVPHHGSRHALFPALLEALKPQAAVIPCGRNPFGHPHAETLDLLFCYVPYVYRTDTDGGVTFYSNGSDWWRIHTFVAAGGLTP